MAGSTKESLEHSEHHNPHKDISPDPVARKPHRRGHCARFWWAYLIAFIAVVLLVVLPVIFVALPRKAQKTVNESTLDLTSLDFTNPTSDTIFVSQRSILRSGSSIHPYIDAFNASLFLENTEPNIKPITYVQLPAVHSTGAAPVNFDQELRIANQDQMNAFTKAVLAREEFRLAVRGRTRLSAGRLHTDVDYNEVLTLRGLNGLKGFNVTEYQVKLIPESDGANLLGKLFIPNPSKLTIAMGNVTLSLSVSGTFLGTSKINDLTLRPGDNYFDMRSYTNQAAVLAKLAQFPNGILPVDVTGNSSIYNGQHLTYYEEALKSSTQRLNLNIGAALRSSREGS